jgi:hypothetical protein
MNAVEQIQKRKRAFWQKWSIAFKVMPLVVVVVGFKFLAHRYSLEVMDLNALFTSLVAGTIFLIGFLISGVLSDYKESEKLPTELSASLKSIYDETYTILKSKDSETAKQFLEYQKMFLGSLMDWFYRKERTRSILDKVSAMNDYFVGFDKEGVQAGYIIRLKNEQSSLRKMIMRIDTIRDTSFVGSAYAIVEAMGFVIAIGLIIIKIEPFYASLFFTTLVVFLITYMFFLIKDLDDPFDYCVNGEGGTEVSLKPLHDLEVVLGLEKSGC